MRLSAHTMSELERLPTFEQRLLALYRLCSGGDYSRHFNSVSNHTVNAYTYDQIHRLLFTSSSGILDTPTLGSRIWGTYGFSIDNALPDWVIEERGKNRGLRRGR